MRITDKALLVYVINIIGENYQYNVGATHVGRHQSEKSFEMKKNSQWMILGLELNREPLW